MADNSVMLQSEEEVAFHYAIGRAITQWAWVENGLYHVGIGVFGENTGVAGIG